MGALDDHGLALWRAVLDVSQRWQRNAGAETGVGTAGGVVVVIHAHCLASDDCAGHQDISTR
jgi:hypothetical protein